MYALKKWAVSPIDYDDAVSLRETIGLLDWLRNPFSLQNLDKSIFKCDARGVHLFGETTNDKFIDARVVSIGYANNANGSYLELEVRDADWKQVKYSARLRDRTDIGGR